MDNVHCMENDHCMVTLHYNLSSSVDYGLSLFLGSYILIIVLGELRVES